MNKRVVFLAQHYLMSVALLAFALLFISHCTTNTIAGAGSEAECKVVGVAHLANGNAAVGARVSAIPTRYVAEPLEFDAAVLLESLQTTTASDGSFEIPSIDTGSYFIVINDGQTGASRMRCSVTQANTVNQVGDQIIKPYTSIVGTIDTVGGGGRKRYVQLHGIDRIVAIGVDGTFRIDSLPADTFQMQILTISSETRQLALQDVVTKPDTATTLTHAPAVVFAVHCGGEAYTGADGVAYHADTCYSHGYADSDPDPLLKIPDSLLFVMSRVGTFSYAVGGLSTGTYLITFKLDENYWHGPGKRVFDIIAEGQAIVSQLDLFVAASGENIALDITIPVEVNDGTLNLDFVPSIDKAKVFGIVVRKKV